MYLTPIRPQAGHAGTLDPMATGLLIVCTGKGTKACDTFMAMSKSYSGIIRLGEGTDTYDAEAEVSERLPWEHIADSDIEQEAASFVGDQLQVIACVSDDEYGDEICGASGHRFGRVG